MRSPPRLPTRAPGRRQFLGGLAGMLVLPWLGHAAGVESARPVAAFRAVRLEGALQALFGTDIIAPSDKIRIGVAKRAENGAVVPLKVEIDLPHVAAITLLASRNPVPLIAHCRLGPRVRPFLATRVKLAETCEVIAVATIDGAPAMRREPVEVVIGGCN